MAAPGAFELILFLVGRGSANAGDRRVYDRLGGRPADDVA